MRFGEYLLSETFLPHHAIIDGLNVQKYCAKPLGRILRDLGYISSKDLSTYLSSYFNLKFLADVSHLETAVKEVKAAPEIFLLEEKFEIKIIFVDSTFVTAVAKEYNEEFVETVENLFGLKCKIFLVEHKLYEHLKSVNSPHKHDSNVVTLHRESSDDEKISELSPYTELFSQCLKEALKRNASDIHFEPTEQGLKILFRIYGDRILWKNLTKEHRDPFTAKIKQIVNLPLASLGMPTDSRATFSTLKTDVRANASPVLDGDKIVLRLLRGDRSFSLKDSGLNTHVTDVINEVSQLSNGLILIAGPTGSGKTTTLYSLLHSLNSERLNISTIENPVEYRFSGINQIDIEENSQMNFARALRALMRQDPDVILVGEIRDEETAELCFKAASTGHLVLSSIHANGAVEVVERLKLLGIDDLSIRSNLRFAGAQRLAKKLCPHCSIKAPPPLDGNKNFRIKNVQGCSQCENGITGRMAVMEFLTQDGLLNKASNEISLTSKGLDDQVVSLAAQGVICSSELPLRYRKSLK